MQITINAPGLAEVFIVLIVGHSPHGLLNSIVLQGSFVNSKFWFFFVLLPRRQASYNLIFVVIDQLTKIIHSKLAQMINIPWLAEVFIPLESMVVTETQSWPPSFGPLGTTFELDCGYHQRVSCKDINPCPDCLQNKLCMADPFLLDLWDYVLGFGHNPEGLVALLTYWDWLKL